MLNPTVNRSSALNNGYQVVLQSQEFHLKPFIFSPFAPEPPVTRHLCGFTSLVLLIVMSSVLTGKDSFISSNLWRRTDDERWWLVCFSQGGHRKGKKTMTQWMEKSNPKILLKAFPETSSSEMKPSKWPAKGKKRGEGVDARKGKIDGRREWNAFWECLKSGTQYFTEIFLHLERKATNGLSYKQRFG